MGNPQWWKYIDIRSRGEQSIDEILKNKVSFALLVRRNEWNSSSNTYSQTSTKIFSKL
jgi:hypothetical protein